MPFEPFAVECPTCGSRLRISSEALLGTIAGCPKCGSMVKIEKAPQVKLGNVPVDSEAITEDGISSELPSIAGTPAGEFKTGFANAPPIPNLDAADQTTLAGPPPTWHDNENWQSDKTKRTRHIAMIATIAISTLSVTVLTFGWFLWMKRSKPVPVAVASKPQTDPSKLATDEVTPFIPDEDDTSKQEPLEQVVPIELVPDSLPESSSGMPAPAEPDAVPQTIIPSSLIPKSPIGSLEGSEEPMVDEDAPTMTELPAGLQQFMPMLLNEGPVQETSLAAPPTINQVEIDAAAEEDSNTLGIEPPKPINLKRDLGFKVALNSKGYPLPSMLLLISEMTGVPIQIDWTSFDLAEVDVAKPIVVDGKAKARTCRDWLDTIAEQVDAEIREKQFVIVMTLTDNAFAKAETGLLDLADFANQSKSAEQVMREFMGPQSKVPDGQADEVVSEVADADESAVEREDKQKGPEVVARVDVMQTRERAQLRILATEMLRRMRSIQPRLSDDRAGRWMQISDDAVLDWQPIGDVDPAELKSGTQPDTPITTAAMLRKISSINDAVCLVNWYDANRRGMRPTRLVMPYAEQVGAAKMLSRVLDPLAMEVRRVDAKHWWVGSNATYDRLPVLVHSDRLGIRREDYVRQLDKIMAADPDAVYRSAYDPVSDRMLMLLPRYVARQLSKVALK